MSRKIDFAQMITQNRQMFSLTTAVHGGVLQNVGGMGLWGCRGGRRRGRGRGEAWLFGVNHDEPRSKRFLWRLTGYGGGWIGGEIDGLVER